MPIPARLAQAGLAGALAGLGAAGALVWQDTTGLWAMARHDPAGLLFLAVFGSGVTTCFAAAAIGAAVFACAEEGA